MTPKEIRKVFDETFNGLPNPIFSKPVEYFEHKGYLCELASSVCRTPTWHRLYKTPLAVFDQIFSPAGLWVTVLTKDGERTELSGHIDCKEDLNKFLEAL